jgi:hypothetical protein
MVNQEVQIWPIEKLTFETDRSMASLLSERGDLEER